jgi:hypothetical protein
MEYHVIFLSWHQIWCYLPLLTWNIISPSSADIESDVISLYPQQSPWTVLFLAMITLVKVCLT